MAGGCSNFRFFYKLKKASIAVLGSTQPEHEKLNYSTAFFAVKIILL